jgi:hypothetical protein
MKRVVMASNLNRNGDYTIGKASFRADYVFKAQANVLGALALIKAPSYWVLPSKAGCGDVAGAFLLVDDAKAAGKAFCKQCVTFEKGQLYEYGKNKFAHTDLFLVNKVAKNEKLDLSELKPSDIKFLPNEGGNGSTGIFIERIAKNIMSADMQLKSFLFDDKDLKIIKRENHKDIFE